MSRLGDSRATELLNNSFREVLALRMSRRKIWESDPVISLLILLYPIISYYILSLYPHIRISFLDMI